MRQAGARVNERDLLLALVLVVDVHAVGIRVAADALFLDAGRL
jgi:hypothetical protein